MTVSRHLAIFGPLPPSRNGIADYTFQIAAGLRQRYSCQVFCDQLLSMGPGDIPPSDCALAFRSITPDTRILHQIGNNPDHVFVLDALRQYGGVVTLHDQNLHYLYEVAGRAPRDFAAGMQRIAPGLGGVYARQWIDDGIKTGANYALFPMLDEIVDRADGIIVHSDFARIRLELLYGPAAAAKVFVIPHFSFPITEDAPAVIPDEVEGDPGLLIVTAGFATFAKRFDWLVGALQDMADRGQAFRWVHAGQTRPHEFDLDALLASHPEVAARSRVTGYISETELNALIATADVLVNLRYPSVGESSGTLARAMAVGRCCVVSDTAAYADLPRDAVIHIPVSRTAEHLAEMLRTLAEQPALRETIGNRARRYSETIWSLPSVIAQYEDVLERTAQPIKPGLVPGTAADAMPPPAIDAHLDFDTSTADIAALLGDLQGMVMLRLHCRNVRHLAGLSDTRPGLLADLLPPRAEIRHVRLKQSEAEGNGSVAVETMLRLS